MHPPAGRIDRILSAGWLLAATPIALSALAAWRDGWVPGGDEAIVAAKIADSATLDPPLVGGWTSLGRMDPEPLHHAGPLGFWLLALPTRVFGAPGAGLAFGAGVVAITSLFAIAFCVRRTGPRAAEAGFLGLIAVMIATLGGDRFVDPNAPYVGVMPLLLVLVAALGVMNGHHRQLFAVIAAGSVAAQTHLGYVPIVAAVLILLAGSLIMSSRDETATPDPALWRRTVPLAICLGLACWIGPIIDQVGDSHNLTRLAAARSNNTEPTVGLGGGFDLLIDTTAVPGGWMRGRAQDGELPDPNALDWVLSSVSIAGVIALGAWARRRRDRFLERLVALSLVVLVVGVVSSASVVKIALGGGLLYYRLFWWPIGVVFTLALLLGAARLLEECTLVGERTPGWLQPLLALSTIVALVLVPTGYRPPDADAIAFLAPNVDLANAVAALPSDPDSIVLLLDEPAGSTSATDPFSMTISAPTLIAELRLVGIDVRFPAEPFDPAGGPTAAYQFQHPAEGDEDATVLYRVGPGAFEEPPDGFRLIEVASDPDSGEPLALAVYVMDGEAPG